MPLDTSPAAREREVGGSNISRSNDPQESFTYGDLEQLSSIITGIERQAVFVKLQEAERESKREADQAADALLDF